MAIKLLVFGQLNELISINDLDLSSIRTTEELKSMLKKKYPALSQINFAVAVNKVLVIENTSLKDQDTVALLPAFSGG